MKELNETPRVILIDLLRPQMKRYQALDRLDELEELVRTYGDLSIVKKLQRRNRPDYRMYIGKGKVKELKELAQELGASKLIINNILKPQQVYNLNEAFRDVDVEVWDRMDLILHIFDNHAESQEAKLQIELAKIRHMGPRIFGLGGEELARQGGGIGTRGIGETNIEIMKRHLRARENKIKEKLDRVQKMRHEQRKNRRRHGLKTVSLVGYTNAGKTTLLNALTGKQEYAADKLFATLDTRTAKIYLPNKQSSVLVSDTIGFIRDLPPELIEAFASTLSETVHADLLLHVIDGSDPERGRNIQVVNTILERLEIETKPVIHIFNKADKLKPGETETIANQFEDLDPIVLSSTTKEGLNMLIERIENML